MELPKNKKGQVAYEFLMMFFFLTLSFTVWIIFSAAAQEDAEQIRRQVHLTDLGLRIQDELYTAIQMQEGFTRTIELPTNIWAKQYNISVEDVSVTAETNRSFLFMESGNYHQSFRLPPTRGEIIKGINTIETRQGYVCLNC